MATISSHALNGVDGSHAGGIAVQLVNCDTGEALFGGVPGECAMDAAGRLTQLVAPERIDTAATYELVFFTGPYWAARDFPGCGVRTIEQIAVRFSMPDPLARYHMPVIISPHSYCVWCSQPE